MRVLRWVVAAAVVAPCVLLAPTQAAARPDAVVRPGKAAFWTSGARRDFTIDVKPGGSRLRVAYTHPDFRHSVYADLYDPAGKRVAGLGGWMSSETFISNPRPGRWTLRVIADQGYNQIKMRAKLETAARAPRKAAPLLPNLRLVPPYEFTFSGMVSGGRGIYAAGGNPATSCTADDIAEHQAVKCLRFSLGPANVGDGPLQLVFPGNQGLVTPGKATQILTWSDGRVTTREAGEFEYHKTHAHYHHSGFGSLELLKVTDPARGTTTVAGAGPKQGFCTADIVIADWTQFANGMQNSADSTCVSSAGLVYDPTAGTKMGLSPGWADIYSWEQDGNYVEFGINGDGRYIIRSTADALNKVVETNERDNTSYAYIQVTGSTIKVLERGRGTGPWDRAKVVANDGLPPLADVQ